MKRLNIVIINKGIDVLFVLTTTTLIDILLKKINSHLTKQNIS